MLRLRRPSLFLFSWGLFSDAGVHLGKGGGFFSLEGKLFSSVALVVADGDVDGVGGSRVVVDAFTSWSVSVEFVIGFGGLNHSSSVLAAHFNNKNYTVFAINIT